MPLTSRRTVMGRKRYKPQEIVAKMRQVDVLVSQGQNMVDAIRQIGVSEVTYYRCLQEIAGVTLSSSTVWRAGGVVWREFIRLLGGAATWPLAARRATASDVLG